jgi:hypothetical protein
MCVYDLCLGSAVAVLYIINLYSRALCKRKSRHVPALRSLKALQCVYVGIL